LKKQPLKQPLQMHSLFSNAERCAAVRGICLLANSPVIIIHLKGERERIPGNLSQQRCAGFMEHSKLPQTCSLSICLANPVDVTEKKIEIANGLNFLIPDS
jgi:hypothetical protein